MTNTAKTQVYPFMRWAILAGCCLSGACFQLVAMAYAPLLGIIAKDLSVDLAQSVQLMTIFMLFSTISFFISGPFVDHFGPAKSIITSTILTFVPTLATMWVQHSYAAVAIIRILQGCSVGFCMSGMVPLIVQWFPSQQRSFALGITGAFVPLGAMLSVVIAPALFSLVGDWKMVMTVISAIPCIVLIYGLVVFSLSRHHIPVVEAPAMDSNLGSGDSLFRIALRSRFTWYGIAVTFATNWILQTVFSLTPSYFSEPTPVGLGLGPMAGGSLTTVLQIASMIAPVIGGFIAGKYFEGRPGGLIIIGMMLSVTYGALQFAGIYNQQVLFFMFLILPGIGIGLLIPMLQSRIAEFYHPSIVGRMNGLWLGVGSFGGTVGLFVSAKSLSATGSYLAGINIIMLVALVGFILAELLNHNKAQHQQPHDHPVLETKKQ